MPTRMMQRNNIVNGFVLVNDEATNKAMAAAKEEVGEAAWKQGHSEEREKIARAKLKEQGVRYETELSGKLDKVDVAETQAKGTTFKKLRVTLEQDNGDKVILSADLNSEYAQRLLPKLESAEPGQQITIGGFATKVERDGREFTNHVATIKDANGQEIKAKENHLDRRERPGEVFRGPGPEYRRSFPGARADLSAPSGGPHADPRRHLAQYEPVR